MKFIATQSNKINSIPVVSGQLIFSRDDRVIYLDTDTRTSFQQIMTVASDTVRQNLTNPVHGFYFVQDTKILWSYDGTWFQITEAPKEQLVFASKESFPTTGEEKVLYVDNQNIYQWINNEYVEMSTSKWEAIS